MYDLDYQLHKYKKYEHTSHDNPQNVAYFVDYSIKGSHRIVILIHTYVIFYTFC